MPSLRIGGRTFRYAWIRERPWAGGRGSWRALLEEEPWLSGTGTGQPAAKKALIRALLEFFVREAYWDAVNAIDAAPDQRAAAWARFEHKVDQFDDDPLRQKWRGERATHDAFIARLEAKRAARWEAVTAELAVDGYRPVSEPTRGDQATCPRCEITTRPCLRGYQRNGQLHTVELCPCCPRWQLLPASITSSPDGQGNPQAAPPSGQDGDGRSG